MHKLAQSFRDLEVYQESFRFQQEVFGVSKKFRLKSTTRSPTRFAAVHAPSEPTWQKAERDHNQSGNNRSRAHEDSSGWLAIESHEHTTGQQDGPPSQRDPCRPKIGDVPKQAHRLPPDCRPPRAAAIKSCIRSSSVAGTRSARNKLSISSDAAPSNTRSRNLAALSSRENSGV